ETIGISSTIVRVRRVAVETSFGRTADSAGSSSTSSKVRPSLPNLLSRSSSNSKGRSIVAAGPAGSEGRRQFADLDERGQAAGFLGAEAAGPRHQHRRGAGGDTEPQRLIGRFAVELGGKPLREQDVAGADGGDRLELRRQSAQPLHLALLPDERVAP